VSHQVVRLGNIGISLKVNRSAAIEMHQLQLPREYCHYPPPSVVNTSSSPGLVFTPEDRNIPQHIAGFREYGYVQQGIEPP
jgi:hypothetical protein